MRRIAKPFYDASVVLKMCIEGVKDVDLKARLNAIYNDLYAAASDYDIKATQAALVDIRPFKGKGGEIVAICVTKAELKSIYTDYFVPADMTTRLVYDGLLNTAPNRLCPMCGFGNVSTLDHYLPKAKFPMYSVVPQNLVPACKDCNTGKLASAATTKENQTIHPYYDQDHFFSEQWLYAEVQQTTPAALKFYVKPPDDWDPVWKQRVAAHFIDFAFIVRLPVQAATELSAISHHLSALTRREDRQQYLKEKAEIYYSLHRNSWQTAMTQALAESEWFYSTGFQAAAVEQEPVSNVQYCLKCERVGVQRESNIFLCEYHADPDIEESDIPAHKGIIPEGAICGAKDCPHLPTKIIRGSCFCAYHYAAINTGKL